ncbi:interleukin-17C [Cheilinus undulatus]|uniref:interleukin-17C n=1 Tax=Cheilinus undulatus TaxID=241271 RepID=UPI001BD5ACF2|nr:interleukin-17C [Cheilinus undulatus]
MEEEQRRRRKNIGKSRPILGKNKGKRKKKGKQPTKKMLKANAEDAEASDNETFRVVYTRVNKRSPPGHDGQQKQHRNPRKKSEETKIQRDRDMDLKQILIFGMFFLVPVSLHCMREDRVAEAAEKKLGMLVPEGDAVETEAAGEPPACPVELYRRYAPQNLSSRSLSPWRYVLRTMPDYFPSSYYEAQCLCEGCILIENGPDREKRLVLSDDYNSVPIYQTRRFLRKELCDNREIRENEETYRLRPVSVKVAVGCTCVRPRVQW